MDVTMRRTCTQGRGQWKVYRWVGICAMLALACLLLLGLVF